MCYPEDFIGIWSENKIKNKIKSKSDRVDQKRLTKNIIGATTFAKFNQSFLLSKISCAQMFCFAIRASLSPSTRPHTERTCVQAAASQWL